MFPLTLKVLPIQLGEYLSYPSPKKRHDLFSDCLLYTSTSDGRETVTRQTFREFKARLCDSRFFPCSRGMIINLEYVKDFNGTDFILKDGKRIPVSRDQAKAARLAFGDFLFQRGHTL